MATDSSSTSQERGTGGLFRSLLLPLFLLVVVVGTLGTLWTSWVRVSEERIRLRETLQGNARMLERMNLPISARMAENLSTAMGRPVALVLSNGHIEGGQSWDEQDIKLAIMSTESAGGYAKLGSKESIAVPLNSRNGHLVVISQTSQLLDWSDARSWGLLAIILILGAICAYVISQRLVAPLTELASRAPEFGEKALPEHLTSRSDELGLLARSLDSARQKILSEQEMRKQSERLAMLGQIATGLAHEIKNPASAILMQADVMENKSAAKLVREEAEDIITLVNQWLFIAKPMPPKMVLHDLAKCLRALISRRAEIYAYHGVEIDLKSPDSLIVECDEKRIMQAVRNLIDNGIAAMPEGGMLEVLLEKNGKHASLEVRDSGKGFSDNALKRFGEPFYSEKEGGMGLGLALVKGVAEAHGGGTQASNKDGKGASVKFWILITHTSHSS